LLRGLHRGLSEYWMAFKHVNIEGHTAFVEEKL
jgi:hypothetical protein